MSNTSLNLQPDPSNEANRKKQEERKFRNTVMSLKEEMKKVIFGQDAAIDAVERAIKISFSGLRTKNKTAGAFLFMGPTGSGKTETAEQLAKKLGMPLRKIDCGEYQHSHEIAKLIGSPPGYLGHRETKGILTQFHEQVKDARYGVLILDEIEKADPAFYQMCLGMLDKATVTDGANNALNFGNVIVIMTSNLGERDRKRTTMGFAPPAQPAAAKNDAGMISADEIGRQARAVDKSEPPKISAPGKSDPSQSNRETLRLFFSPEFLGRLDGVINFADLGSEYVPLIADKFIDELKEQARTNTKGPTNLELTPAARALVVEQGYKPDKGARSIRIFMDQAIVGRLADELIGGELEGGGDALVDAVEDPATHKKSLSFLFGVAARDAIAELESPKTRPVLLPPPSEAGRNSGAPAGP